MRFVCDGCRTALVVQDSNAGISGPCPQCSTWIDAESFQPIAASKKSLYAGVSTRKRQGSRRAGKGRVSADGHLDHQFNEKREMYGTLKILAIGLAAMAVIFFIVIYMNQ